jgi:hypothetical protein
MTDTPKTASEEAKVATVAPEVKAPDTVGPVQETTPVVEPQTDQK